MEWNGRKYLQNINLIKYYYLKYIRTENQQNKNQIIQFKNWQKRAKGVAQ
jgi:hypothetical protein